MAMRILAVLAAAFLVGAFALATLASPDLPLGHALFLADHELLVAVQDWFLPAAFGLICGGGAYSLGSRHAPRSRRRRS